MELADKALDIAATAAGTLSSTQAGALIVVLLLIVVVLAIQLGRCYKARIRERNDKK